MGKHVIVISLDAMVCEDLEYARELPNFKRFLSGSVIERVRTIYPSLTHPVHATLLTGAPAGVTGVIGNLRFKPDEIGSSEWYNNLSDIECDTILHAAKRKGLTTAVTTWPLTSGKSDVIDYLVPGVLNYELTGREHEPLEVYRERGMTANVESYVREAFERFGFWDVHPEIDELQVYVAEMIIKEYKPNLLFTHLSYIDSMRHSYGLFSDKVHTAIECSDRWLGQLYRAVEEAGILENTSFVILSDHGHLAYDRVIAPNRLFVNEGLIRLDESGRLIDYDAIFAYAGLSVYVYLRDPECVELRERVLRLISDDAVMAEYGFSAILSREEAQREYGLDGDFVFVIPGIEGVSFTGSLTAPASTPSQPKEEGYGHSAHGHRPELGPQPIFIGYGPDFKEGVVKKEGSILDHAPTVAKILGLELHDSVGSAVEEILK